MPVDKLINAQSDFPRRRAALNLSMAFAPGGYSQKPMSGGSASRSPVIVHQILGPLESDDPCRAREAAGIAKWFPENTQVRGHAGVKESLKQAKKAAEARHGFSI